MVIISKTVYLVSNAIAFLFYQFLCCRYEIQYGKRRTCNHREAHLDATLGVVGPWLGAPGHTVVAIAKGRNLFTSILLAQEIKSAEEVV